MRVAEFRFGLGKHAPNFLRLADVRLNDKSVGASFANFAQGLLRGGFILHIVNGDVYFLFGELESDASANTPRTAGDQRALG